MSGKHQDHKPNSATIRAILRLFDEPLPDHETLAPWYRPPGEIVDGNAILNIVADSDFIDEAAWRIQGRETASRQRARWLKRLHRSSRSSVLVGMRFKTAGRKLAVKIPGLWLALLLDPPGRQLIGKGHAGSLLDSIRHKLVAWRFRRSGRKPTPQADTACAAGAVSVRRKAAG